jgi:S-adenosylmethionine:tRNA ribosyltransferase-isomerase
VAGKVIELLDEGDRLVRFDSPLDLETVGELALPPYIDRMQERVDRERYQTIYASKLGAIAAPTAGLHFTPALLDRLPHEFITLHVGAGTFRPVKTAIVTEHRMHLEEFEVSKAAAANIEGAKKILAVGTTTVRAIESLMRQFGEIRAGKHRTDIFIHPPFEFRRVDSLLTNFHLPKSTLLMLVAAFAGREFVLEAYREAIKERYRFFSYGDCMLIR